MRQDGTSAPVEIPFTLPGEKVMATVMKKRKGRLELVINPSPERIEPRCVHFGECGGCRFQHLSYETQLRNKAEGVAELFGQEVSPIIGSPLIWGYRNKMEFTFSSDKAGNLYLGLVKAFGHQRVVDLQECHLVSPWFTEAVKITREWWKESGLPAFKGSGGVLRTLTCREGQGATGLTSCSGISGCDQRNLEFCSSSIAGAMNSSQTSTFLGLAPKSQVHEVKPIAHSGDRLVMLTYSGEIHSLEKWAQQMGPVSVYAREHRAEKGVATSFHLTHLSGPQHIREVFSICYRKDEAPCELEFLISPTAFFQPNPKQAANLISLAMQMADVTADQLVFDLYCGTGTLGICAAKNAKRVIGIEVCEEAVLDARINAQQNDLQNYEIYAGTTRSVLASTPLPKPDLVFVNPPRSGLEAETIAWLIEAKPEKILYISCNPKTQALDVAKLGYKVSAIQPVDQFPHTAHVENIVLLIHV